MDRRSFLASGATLALLPLTDAPAFAAVAPRRERRCEAQRAVRRIFQRAGSRLARASRPARASTTGRTRELRSTASTCGRRTSRAREDAARDRAALARLQRDRAGDPVADAPRSTAKS